MAPYSPFFIILFLIHHIEPRVRMIPHGILDTDLHMDYNSVFHTGEVDLSRARTPNLEIERIVSLSHAYAPSLSNSTWF